LFGDSSLKGKLMKIRSIILSLVLGACFIAPLHGQIQVNNKVYHAGPQACSLTATTGAFAAGSAPVTVAAPQLIRAASGNMILAATTTAAANVIELICDITVPGWQLNGPTKGVTITQVNVLYGVQTTAFTSIGAPTINSVTYPNSTAAGAAAAATVLTTAGGTLTVTPTALQLTTTTLGQCFNEAITLGTPLLESNGNPNIQYTVDQVFNQTAAASTVMNVCDVYVTYNEVLT
jgi:hypothetical protein